MSKPVAVIGGGLTGLTSAIRLAEQGRQVHLFEAAPALGGRTRSFYDTTVEQWVDNGPHLLIGAYQATRKLLDDVGAASNIAWQKSLQLPLWDRERGYFSLQPKPWLPFPVALLVSLAQLPGHGMKSMAGMLRIAKTMRSPAAESVSEWLSQQNITPALQLDLIEPLCLGAMNQPMQQADCRSFARVLDEAFANHASARLGWFNQPLTQAVIEPLKSRLDQLGVVISTSTAVKGIKKQADGHALQHGESSSGPYSAVVLALPAHARNRLLGIDQQVETEAITNVHLWYEEALALPQPLIGLIGRYSQWFFDVSAQTGQQGASHLCAVISAEAPSDRARTLQKVQADLAEMLGLSLPAPLHSKIVCEQRATVVTSDQNRRFTDGTIFDASEAPCPGDLPATIEEAIRRGETAAKALGGQRH